MPTEELEKELRRVFARAAADFQHPEQARQRLFQRNYRPRRGYRRLAAGITAAAAAAAVLGLGLTGVFGSAPVGGTGTIRAMAFLLVEHANGTVTLSINPKVLVNPGTLQSDLQQDGIPAIVTTGSFCSSEPIPTGLMRVVTASVRSVTINPAAIPSGTELSFGNFQLLSGEETAVQLVDINSYTCAGTFPASVPDGDGLGVVWPSGPKQTSHVTITPISGRFARHN